MSWLSLHPASPLPFWREGTTRYRFLDLYRGLFVLFMVEGHFVRELLQHQTTLTPLFSFHELLHGLTGPGFFFGAGFTFSISTRRRWESLTQFSPAVGRRLLRAVTLIFVGYALHLPFLSLGKTLTDATAAQWGDFLAFGVLQTIGVCLLFLTLLVVFVRNDRLFPLILLSLIPVLTYASPWVGAWSVRAQLPSVLAAAFNRQTGSTYPLLPPAVFVVAGAYVAWSFLSAVDHGQERRFALRLAGTGVALVVLSTIFEFRNTIPFYGEYFWTVGPHYTWLRLGLLCVLLSGLWWVEDFAGRFRKFWLPSWITTLGVESFFVYTVHLLLLCGWVTNPHFSLRSFFGGQLSFGSSLLFAAGAFPILFLLAHSWHSLKKRHQILYRGLIGTIAFSVVWSFLFNPY